MRTVSQWQIRMLANQLNQSCVFKKSILLTCKVDILLVIFLLPNLGFSQVCSKNNTPQSVSPGNYEILGNGTIRHKITNLTWQRCTYGQTWNGSTCIGSPIRLTWVEALQIGEQNNLRLPNIKELHTIFDYQCIYPPISLTLFPNTYATWDVNQSTEIGETRGLWSSSPYITSTDNVEKTKAWYIGLGKGVTNYKAVDSKNYVKFLVKN